MSYEELPSDFDIVILGTGLTSTITAAAFSRIGLKVLHLDRNDYYGGLYANFNLTAIEAWKLKNQELNIDDRENDATGKDAGTLPEDLTCISLPEEKPKAFNLSSSFHVRERTAEEEKEAAKKSEKAFPFFKPSKPAPESKEESEEEEKASESPDLQNDQAAQIPQPQSMSQESSQDRPSVTSQEPSEKQPGENFVDVASSAKNDSAQLEKCDNPIEDEKPSNQTSPQQESNNEDRASEKSPEEKNESEEAISTSTEPAQETKREWTVGDLKDDWRRFCFDLSPKVLFCCGDIIELLIRSDVARYCEFRTVSRVLTLLKDKLEPVPCSRADVFSSKIVSLIEKRLMMKFLQFAADFENNSEEYKDHKDSTFREFLKFKKLTPNLQHFVQHAIAMVDDSASTEHGLVRTRKFLQSLGRYGNTAFLFPLYGTGELSQAFSRMSAVFGGVYCLMETATHLLADTENRCCGIVTSKGQKINCKYLVAEPSYLPVNFTKRLSSGKISRGIFITNSSISPSSDEDLTLLNFICKKDASRSVTVLEMPHSACVCPQNLYVVYLTRVSDSDDPEEDLREVKEKLFAPFDCALNAEENRPTVLWSMHFTLNDWSEVEVTDQAVKNVVVSSEGGDADIDLDKCVPEAKRLFHQVCPDEEFLPIPPNPEDIIHVDDEESPVVTCGSSEFEKRAEDPEKKGKDEPDSSNSANPENKPEENPATASCGTDDINSEAVKKSEGVKEGEGDTCDETPAQKNEN